MKRDFKEIRSQGVDHISMIYDTDKRRGIINTEIKPGVL
jgi:hypothetical protein